MATKVQVVFYSRYGHIYKMAEVVAAGAREAPDTEVSVYQVPELASDEVLQQSGAKAARAAFETFSQTTREDRVALLVRIRDIYSSRMAEIGAAISDEMGAPLPFAEKFQAGIGLGHIASTLAVTRTRVGRPSSVLMCSVRTPTSGLADRAIRKHAASDTSGAWMRSLRPSLAM
jgi:acyl-CoA reductase-like NAD-dependent aldehyde dehydrogenase